LYYFYRDLLIFKHFETQPPSEKMLTSQKPAELITPPETDRHVLYALRVSFLEIIFSSQIWLIILAVSLITFRFNLPSVAYHENTLNNTSITVLSLPLPTINQALLPWVANYGIGACMCPSRDNSLKALPAIGEMQKFKFI
jgi:hypothetical protein